MPQIEISFQTFKNLTSLRASEEITYDDVIDEMIELTRNLPRAHKPPKSAKQPTVKDKPWRVSNTSFPSGSEFLADYKGKSYSGIVAGGCLETSDGSKFTTPSAAAIHITGSNTNGWRFWKCKLPGASQFVLIERLRGKEH